MSAVGLLGLVVALWFVVAGLLCVAMRRDWARLWQEPVFARPVLLLESDDWGAGPPAQAGALDGIADVLERHRDAAGRPPVVSLALVLAVPDGAAIAAGSGYRRIELDAPPLAPVLDALRRGLRRQVFSVQLHGYEHFWPGALLASADPTVAAWLREASPAATEQLPSHLQSRWVDASRLPSAPLPGDALRRAVAAEIDAYRRIVGAPPAVVVPPTFVWTREVERAWAAGGVEFIVTPGWRSTQRNAAGLPDGDEGPIVNGDRADGVTYLVRSDYFEPARGRDAAHALRALARAAAQGRPCILENHRDNFVFDAGQARRSLAELDALCAGALRQRPGLRFLSTVELGRILGDRDPQWIVMGWRERLPFVWQRLKDSGRPWKLMRLTGMAVLGSLLVRWLGVPAAACSAAGAS
jgi:hypothetical protein